jgi:tripartite-type tricarboxylate transporter receptor subunit TctC
MNCKTIPLLSLTGCVALAGALTTGSAFAQSPRSAQIVVAFTPGGPVDFVARLLAEPLGRELGNTVVVENRAGANGNIGAEYVAKATPDGSVMFLSSVGAIAISPSLYSPLPYDPVRDFAPVSVVVNNSTVFVVNVSIPANSASEFVANTIKAAQPTPFGSSGSGSTPHLTLELLQSASGAKLLHIPYKGAAQVIADVLADRVAGFLGDLPGFIGQIKGGKLKAIAVAAPRRHTLLPDVKTFAEQGINGVESNNWYAILVPAKTPRPTVDAINRGIRAALANETVRTRLRDSGAEPAASSPDELAALIKSDTAKWSRIIREKNIKAD